MHRFLLLVLLTISALGARGQETIEVDTVKKVASDTIFIKKGGRTYTATAYAKRFQPRKAILFAAVLPGSGQIYNKKYWKVPLVYGGFIFITSVVSIYNDRYHTYQNELYGLLESPSIPPASGYTEEQLRTLVDTYRRERDFWIILDGMFYILQLVDAHVDAHLKEFDLNPDLKVKLEPTMQPSFVMGPIPSLSLTFRF